jgi:hypothetical protein
MPKNKLIYYGILIVAASALLWGGYQITMIALKLLPWTGAAGVLLIVLGLVMESKKGKSAGGEEPDKGE